MCLKPIVVEHKHVCAMLPTNHLFVYAIVFSIPGSRKQSESNGLENYIYTGYPTQMRTRFISPPQKKMYIIDELLNLACIALKEKIVHFLGVARCPLVAALTESMPDQVIHSQLTDAARPSLCSQGKTIWEVLLLKAIKSNDPSARPQTSCFSILRWLHFAFAYPASNTQHATPSIQHPASSMQH